MSVKRLSTAAVLVSLGVVFSTFYIPIGVAKVFPVQHFINVLAGVTLGPLYSVCMAFVTSLIRIMMGTGSILAFPGSMIGALLCGLLFKASGKVTLASIGEVIGTGILGALAAYPIALLLLSRKVALYGFLLPFSISSLAGAALSLLLIMALKKTGIFNQMIRANTPNKPVIQSKGKVVNS